MEASALPVETLVANCSHCGAPVEFAIFTSGDGYDFSTYRGKMTNALYRLDLSKIHNLGQSLKELLAPALAREGRDGLIAVPNDLPCVICRRTEGVVGPGTKVVVSEARIDGYDL